MNHLDARLRNIINVLHVPIILLTELDTLKRNRLKSEIVKCKGRKCTKIISSLVDAKAKVVLQSQDSARKCEDIVNEWVAQTNVLHMLPNNKLRVK